MINDPKHYEMPEEGGIRIDGKLTYFSNLEVYIKDYIKQMGIAPFGVMCISNNAKEGLGGPSSGRGTCWNLYTLCVLYWSKK